MRSHHTFWLAVGATMTAFALGFIAVAGGLEASRKEFNFWCSAPMFAAYGFFAIGVVSFAAAVRNWRFPFATAIPETTEVGEVSPSTPRGGDARAAETIKVADLFDAPGAVVRHRTFRNVRLVGPAVASFRQCSFPTLTILTPGGYGPEAVLWELPEGVPLTGAVAFEQCIFDNCEFLDVGFVGTSEGLQAFRDAIARMG